jgi:hypothetical protein
MTSLDLRANAEASKIYGQEPGPAAKPDVDLPEEHERDRSGRTAAAERG